MSLLNRPLSLFFLITGAWFERQILWVGGCCLVSEGYAMSDGALWLVLFGNVGFASFIGKLFCISFLIGCFALVC